jgi:AcrR family transcriptional regulator
MLPHFEPVRLVSKFTLPSDPMTDQSRPGRKRSEQSRLSILTATLELVAEAGYGGLTVEGIAARSGVGKQTIYRWWPSKADVLLDALAMNADLRIPIPDEGSFRADLAHFLGSTFELGQKSQVADTLRALMAQAQIDPEFGKRFREDFLFRRRDALGEVVDRARERGELPPGVNPGTMIDVVFGTLWYRLLATREPVGRGLAGELVALLAGQGASTAETPATGITSG